MTVDFSKLSENPFAVLFDLGAAFAPQMSWNSGALVYTRVCSRGRCELHDYNCGVLYVRVSTVGYGRGALNRPEQEVDDVNYCVLFTVGCADDGAWQAWSKVMSKQKCNDIVDKIKKEVLDDLITLPTYKELNDLLFPYGLYGEYTG